MKNEPETNDDPLLQANVANDSNSPFYMGGYGWLDNFSPLPPFGHAVIDRMLCEPKVNMGLQYLYGAINADTRYEVQARNPEVQQFVQTQLERFMARGMNYGLKSVERGFSANEILTEKQDGLYYYSNMTHIPYQAAKAIVKNGQVVGVKVEPEFITNEDETQQALDRVATKAKYIGGVKKYWTVHDRHINNIWGRSRLFGAHIPYHSLCSNGGVWEGTNLWFRKNAFDGGEMYFPEGHEMINGQKVSFREIAQRMLDLKRSGGTICMTSKTDDKGNPLWKYVPPSSAEAPATLLQWNETLGNQIWEGIGVPPELADSAAAGGSNNKRVVQTAFYTFCTQIATYIIHDFNDQFIKAIVKLNFRKRVPENQLYYEIKNIKVLNEMDNLNIQNQMGKKENNNPFNNGVEAGSGDSNLSEENITGDKPQNPRENLRDAPNNRFSVNGSRV